MWTEEHRQRYRAKRLPRKLTAERREYTRAYRKTEEYKARHRPRARAYQKKYLKRDVQARLASNLRIRLGHVLRGETKSKPTVELLGCSIPMALLSIGSKWKPGMSWSNWSARGWHIDHIKPLASFNLADPHQQAIAFHISNLQPLWAEENLRKQ